MKIAFIIIGIFAILFSIFQIYTTMATGKTETQPYKVLREEGQFEIRYYPAAIMAKISMSSSSYRELGRSGFGTLAGYIFGGNDEKKQIAMTSPVHMDIGDSTSTMAFVMPADLSKEDMPTPNNAGIQIETSEPEYVAVWRFGGFANTSTINEYIEKLKQSLQDKGIAFHGNFRYLGYNPPYQIFGRRNEVIVAIDPVEMN
jgi:hypothetical protein